MAAGTQYTPRTSESQTVGGGGGGGEGEGEEGGKKEKRNGVRRSKMRSL